MVKWLSQWDSFRCGPIALANVMRWAGIKEFEGHKVNRKFMKGYLCELCKTDKDGTFPLRFNKVLAKIPGIRILADGSPTLQSIKECIQDGGIVVLNSPWKSILSHKYTWHYGLIVKVLLRGLLYCRINDQAGMARWLSARRTISKELKYEGTTAIYVYKDTQ